MRIVDYDEIKDFMENLITKVPEDYVYPKWDRPNHTCHYVYEGKPDCMVGQWLVDGLGMPILAIDYRWEGINIETAAKRHLGTAVSFTPEAMDALVHLQQYQDDGGTWHDAYALIFEGDLSVV